MTTFSLEEIMAICMTDNIQNIPNAAELTMANMPLIKMAAKIKIHIIKNIFQNVNNLLKSLTYMII